VALALGVALGGVLLRDWRVRLRTLIPMDPPPGPVEVAVAGHRLSITGARVTGLDGNRLSLWAWAPDPALRVIEAAGDGTIAVTVANLPRRARVEAPGPVEDEPAGSGRRLRFAPRSTRRLAVTGPEQPLSFFVLGDTGDNPGFGSALRLAELKGADFLLHTGDVVYDDAQMANIRMLVDTAALPLYFVRGNHDYRNDRRVRFLRELGPPYYVFRIGGATFVALDNTGDYLPGLWRHSTQYAWWTAVLGESRAGPLFVVMHKPPFDRRTGPRQAAMFDRPFARQLQRDFRRAGVDAVFTGHVHAAHLWVEDGVFYVVSGEGFETPLPSGENRVAWARLEGGRLAVDFIPIWRGGGR
jgi:predicted phosphodiesterase